MVTNFQLYEKFKHIDNIREGDWIILKGLYPYNSASDIDMIMTVRYKIGKVFTVSKGVGINTVNIFIKYYEPLPKFTRTIQYDDKKVSVISVNTSEISKYFLSRNKEDLQKILHQDQFDL